MTTNELKTLHKRSIKQLEMIEECERRISSLKKIIENEDQKESLKKWLMFSKSETEIRVLTLQIVETRIIRWYYQTRLRLKFLDK